MLLQSIRPYALCLLLGTLLAPQSFADGHKDSETVFQEAKQESRELLDTLKSYSAEQRDEAVQATQQALNKLDAQIEALEAKVDKSWDRMSEATRKQTRESLQALRKQRNEVAEWYGGLKNSSADAWDHVKKGFAKAYEALRKAWEKSAREFKDSQK